MMVLFACGWSVALGQTAPQSAPQSQGQEKPNAFGDKDVAALLELLNTPVTVASNVMSDRNKQPVSVTTITRNQIQMSGARRLSDVLNLYVPGFFMVEDQDDSIAAFRGIAPDNNSKVMFLVNGHVMNTEWFLGPPDSLLNGIALDYIERVDVIRGPGSVTLGQGALLGVINVVTRVGVTDGHTVSGGVGKDNAYFATYESGTSKEGLKTYAHVTASRYDGQDIRPEGNATRNWEGVKGGKLFDGGNRLGKANNLTAVMNFAYDNASLDYMHADQNRDMYNFRRDRSAYEQSLDSLTGSFTVTLAPKHTLKTSFGVAQDDYILHSNLGFTMGGTREYRKSLSSVYNGNFGAFNLALGAELKRFDMGRRNRDGNNFVANSADATLLDSPNQKRQWVYSKSIDTQGLFAEAFLNIDKSWDVFGAFRYDKHPFWGSNVTPRFGALYSPGEELNFRLSYQTGFRGAPGVHYAGGFQNDGLIREENFDKIFAATAGNEPNLEKVQPEKMSSIEFQTVWSPTQTFKVDAVLFRNVVNHVIGFGAFGSWIFTPVPNNIGTDQKGDWDGYWYFQNTKGSFTSHGAEVTVTYHHPLVDVMGSHSLVRLDSVDDTAYDSLYITPKVFGKHFKSYPEDITRLHAILFPYDRMNFSLTAVRYGTWYTQDSSFTTDKTGQGSIILDGAFRVLVGEHFQFLLSATNLTNGKRLYPLTEGPAGTATDPRPGTPAVEGRTYWLKASYTF